jgi:hypothetical protein
MCLSPPLCMSLSLSLCMSLSLSLCMSLSLSLCLSPLAAGLPWAAVFDLEDVPKALGEQQLAAIRAWTCTPLCYILCFLLRSPSRSRGRARGRGHSSWMFFFQKNDRLTARTGGKLLVIELLLTIFSQPLAGFGDARVVSVFRERTYSSTEARCRPFDTPPEPPRVKPAAASVTQ